MSRASAAEMAYADQMAAQSVARAVPMVRSDSQLWEPGQGWGVFVLALILAAEIAALIWGIWWRR